MSKKIIAVFLLVLAIYTYNFAYTNVNNYKPQYGYVIKNSNLRSNPSTKSKIHKVIPKNTNIKILGDINNFYIVQTNENLVGAISKSLVKKDNSKKPSKAATYTNLREKNLYTSKNGLINIRSGPSTSFSVVSKMNEKDKVKVIGKIKNFYLIITAKNNIGMVREDLLKKVNGNTNNTNSNNQTTNNQTNNSLVLITGTDTEQEMLNYINKARENKGLPKLKLAKRLTEMARLKSSDMTKYNYFSHDSKTYGSPFKMLKDFGISYKQAGENIAGNSTIKGAFDSWINSSTHSQNIYSNAYNYVGIGISKSQTYGYIITAIFIGK